jgi:hypothetical protein
METPSFKNCLPPQPLVIASGAQKSGGVSSDVQIDTSVTDTEGLQKAVRGIVQSTPGKKILLTSLCLTLYKNTSYNKTHIASEKQKYKTSSAFWNNFFGQNFKLEGTLGNTKLCFKDEPTNAIHFNVANMVHALPDAKACTKKQQCKTNGNSVTKGLNKFCSDCGTKSFKDHQRHCTECGNKL